MRYRPAGHSSESRRHRGWEWKQLQDKGGKGKAGQGGKDDKSKGGKRGGQGRQGPQAVIRCEY